MPVKLRNKTNTQINESLVFKFFSTFLAFFHDSSSKVKEESMIVYTMKNRSEDAVYTREWFNDSS
jgi:hypothetical protein